MAENKAARSMGGLGLIALGWALVLLIFSPSVSAAPAAALLVSSAVLLAGSGIVSALSEIKDALYQISNKLDKKQNDNKGEH